MNSQRQLQIQQFVQSLSDDELHILYHQLNDRMRLARRARELYALQDFRLLDRVTFEHAGRRVEGTVIRINQRTVSVMSIDSVRWTVSPQFLRKLEPNTRTNTADVMDMDVDVAREDSDQNASASQAITALLESAKHLRTAVPDLSRRTGLPGPGKNPGKSSKKKPRRKKKKR